MSSFESPWVKDLEGLRELVKDTPSKNKLSFDAVSKDALERVCDQDALHVWESDSDLDNLLQLVFVIAKLCNLGEDKEEKAKTKQRTMVILVEDKVGRNNFSRICQLVAYLVGNDGKKRLDGTVREFGRFIVVRGWNNSVLEGQAEALDKAVQRVNVALQQGLKIHDGKKKVVWHHGPVIFFLDHWIHNTTPSLRNALHAITVTGALELTSSISPSILGRANKSANITRLEGVASHLSFPVVFLDASSQLLDYTMGTYMYYFAYYVHTLIPSRLREAHLHKGLDDLVTFCFRLLGASISTYTNDIIRKVKEVLPHSKARDWAKNCVDKDSYTKENCRNAGKTAAIFNAILLANDPFARFDGVGAPAFARLPVGPAIAANTETYVAAPIKFDFESVRIRVDSEASLHVLIPTPAQDTDKTKEKITHYVQGLMLGCLTRMRQDKGDPDLPTEQKEIWKAVMKACKSALDGCRKDKFPTGVEDKVKEVYNMMDKTGCWSGSLGLLQQTSTPATPTVPVDALVSSAGTAPIYGKPTAAPAPPKSDTEPLRSYGFGMNMGAPGQQQGIDYSQQFPAQTQTHPSMVPHAQPTGPMHQQRPTRHRHAQQGPPPPLPYQHQNPAFPQTHQHGYAQHPRQQMPPQSHHIPPPPPAFAPQMSPTRSQQQQFLAPPHQQQYAPQMGHAPHRQQEYRTANHMARPPSRRRHVHHSSAGGGGPF